MATNQADEGNQEVPAEDVEFKVPSLTVATSESQEAKPVPDKLGSSEDPHDPQPPVAPAEGMQFKVPSLTMARPISQETIEPVTNKLDSGEEPQPVPDAQSAEAPADGVEFRVPSLTMARPKSQEAKPGKPEDPQPVAETPAPQVPPPAPPSKSENNAPTHTDSATPPLSYNEPTWSSVPPYPCSLTVIKSGTVIQEIRLSDKPFHVFGRLPACDVQLEHPSVSRYHAVLQYRQASSDDTGDDQVTSTGSSEEGFFVYDLGSTHGTYINKRRVQGRCYCRLRLGQMVKFGGSSRLFLLEGGEGDQQQVEEAAEQEISEIVRHKELLEQRKAEMEARQQLLEKEREDMGVMWGMVVDDVPSGGGEGKDIDIEEEREAFYKDDPKKALKKCFDREGLELEYEVEEEGPPRDRIYTVRVRLPMDAATGEAIYAEASLKGKKKDAVQLCALNACRMLDAQDMLRHSAKVHKRKKRDWAENDYYDSDEDTFLDRTGLIEKKRKRRMKKAGALEDAAENYESLQAKLRQTLAEISTIEKRLARDKQGESEDAGVDSLEAYMGNLGSHLDKGKRLELKQQLHSLIHEKQRLTKLVELVRGTELPALKSPEAAHPPPEDISTAKQPDISPTTVATKDHTPSRPQISAPSETRIPEQESEEPSSQQAPPRRKRARVIGPARPPQSHESEAPRVDARDDQKDEDAEDYADWMPPARQTGDGRTHLNDKFGY